MSELRNLVIVQGKEDVKDLKKYLVSNNKIVSFDFYAHKELKKMELPYEMIEEYFDVEEQEKMDNLAIKLTTGWYKIEKIKKLMKFEELNLGNLLEIELITYIFEMLKKILGLKKILAKEQFSTIYASSLSEISEFFNKEKTKTIQRSKRSEESLYFDKIEIPINIGTKIKTITISRDKYTKIKKISEKISDLVLNLKYKPKIDDEIVLLLDFNPVMYPNLLKELKIKNKNIVLLNQRRPAIWNLESMKIVKNSKCKILNLEDEFAEKKIKNLSISKNKILEQINEIWKNEDEFEAFFSINGKSFWKLIREQFKKMLDRRFMEAITRKSQIENFFEKTQVKSILEWAHNGFEEKIVVNIAEKKEIPVFLLQHGTAPINEKWNKYHNLMPYFPSSRVKLITWGKAMKKFVLENKISEKQVIDLGSPKHDLFFSTRNTVNHNTVLIAANGFMHNNFAGNDSRSYQYLENYFSEICRLVPKLSSKQIIVKLHPGQFYYDMKPLIQKIDSKIHIFQNQNIMDLIKTCDIMISLNYSTALLDAMILQKPTMLVLPEKQGYEKEDFITKEATLFEPKIEKIEQSLKNILNNQEFRENLIKKGNEFVDYYLVNQGNASKEVAEFIEK